MISRIHLHICVTYKKNLSKNTIHFVEDDLNFISRLTGELMIGTYQDNFKIEQINVKKKFDEVRKYNVPVINKLSEEDVAECK